MLDDILTFAFLQGWCPMCAGMGVWMVLVWLLVIAAIVGVVWMITRGIRR